jgi:predicted oxidoreductase
MPETLSPRRATHFVPVAEAPFYLMRVRSGITFAYAGLRTDCSMHVLDDDSRPIPGLLAAGVDVGGIWTRGYGGGISVALVTGLAAAETAARGTLAP